MVLGSGSVPNESGRDRGSGSAGLSGSGLGPCHGPLSGGEKLPSLFIERPKMPRATWEALRNHILKERQRKKEEHEQTQEVKFDCYDFTYNVLTVHIL